MPALTSRQLAAVVSSATGLDDAGRILANRMNQRQIARWADLVADEDAATFRKRLSWDGLALPRRGGRARAERPAPATELPSWAKLLEEVGAEARMLGAAARTRTGRRARPRWAGRLPFPFEEVFEPFARAAGARLDARDPPGKPFVSDAAMADLERGLIRQLTYIGYQTLAEEAVRLKKRAGRGRGSLAEALFDDGLGALFRRYPPLAKLLAVVCEQWVASSAELLARARDDQRGLARRFFDGRPLGSLRHVETMLGDSHRRGRTVCSLTFSSNETIIYKPRSLATEVAFAGFLRWCARRSRMPLLRTPAVWDRGAYGWVERVSPRPCRTRREVARFHERAGMLLAVFYLLGESDCHNTNLLAVGEHPIPIDLETLLRPELASSRAPRPAHRDLDVVFRHNVASTAVLPRWGPSPAADGAPFAEGGLASAAGRTTMRFRPALGDGVPRVDQVPERASPNRPTFRGKTVPSEEHVGAIVAGFRTMYGFLADRRRALASPRGPLARFAQPLASRIVCRATREYAEVQHHSYSPERLRDAGDHVVTLDVLARRDVGDPVKPPLWPTLASEVKALARNDIPIFHARATDRDLQLDEGGAVRGVFARSGWEAVQARVAELGPLDLARQLHLVRASFACYVARRPAEARTVRSGALPRAATDTRLVAAAVRLGEALDRSALAADRGAITWLTPEIAPSFGRYELKSLGLDYGGGAAGIAVFLAALGRVTGRLRFTELAQQALAPLRGRRRAAGGETELGGIRGIGAAVYSLTRCASLLDDRSLLAEARRICAVITPEDAASDDRLDVIGGSAGMLLAVLALHRASPAPGVLALARALGDHLLARRHAGRSGLRAWRTLGGRKLAGLLHGQSGIALAMARLGAATGHRPYLVAAEEAFAYERGLYSDELGYWPDRRPGVGGPSEWLPASLCNGAAGVLLGRLGCLTAVDAPELRADCEAALRACAKVGVVEVDHVCCGNFGRLEVEALAADTLGRPALRDAARRRASLLLERAEADGGFALLGPAPDVAPPSLYTGVAGIGYTLLRLAVPELASIFAWD